MRNIDETFARLAQSPFRRRFHLGRKERSYAGEKGLDAILAHACDFIDQRLAPARPHNDGKQTPFRGHPVFIAQHATATCCRSCLAKWHHIPQGKPLDTDQRAHVLALLEYWFRMQDVR